MAIKKIVIPAFVLAVALSGLSHSQMIGGKPSTGSTGFVYTYWKLEQPGSPDVSLGQYWMPLSGFVALQENLEARYYLAGSNNNYQNGNFESHLDGIGDTRVEITRSFSENHFFISGGVNLATGKTELAFDPDRTIIELLSESYLVFPMRRFGEGLGFNGTFGAAKSWGKTVAGAALSYDIIGKYTPYIGLGEYNPGDVFTAEFGLNTHGEKTAVALGVNFLTYSDDKMDNAKVFRQGQQVGLSISAAYDNKEVRFSPSAHYTVRGRNTRYQTGSETIRDRLKLYGNELELGLEIGRYFRGGWNFSPMVSLFQIDNNEDSYGDSKILSYGVSVGKKFSDRILVGSWFKILTGDTDNGRVDLSGYQISASVKAVL